MVRGGAPEKPGGKRGGGRGGWSKTGEAECRLAGSEWMAGERREETNQFFRCKEIQQSHTESACWSARRKDTMPLFTRTWYSIRTQPQQSRGRQQDYGACSRCGIWNPGLCLCACVLVGMYVFLRFFLTFKRSLDAPLERRRPRRRRRLLRQGSGRRLGCHRRYVGHARIRAVRWTPNRLCFLDLRAPPRSPGCVWPAPLLVSKHTSCPRVRRSPGEKYRV